MFILGISCFYHNSAAVLLKDGKLLAAAEEERFTRVKYDSSFPEKAIEFCLDYAGIKSKDLSYVGFYEKPFLKFERLLQTYLSYAPKGLSSFLEAMPVWAKEKLWIKSIIQQKLNGKFDIIFVPHHLSHAASSFFVSPFEKAAILTMDGVGEWQTTTWGYGENNKIYLSQEINFPHSLGLLYSAFTYYCGFKVDSGEYKLMGLAPNGQPKYVQKIYKNLIDVKDDGSFALNMDYFTYEYSLKMIGQKFEKLFGKPALSPETLPHPQFYCDIAASIQKVTEEVILKMVNNIYQKTQLENLCLAGGVALNCVANGRLLKEGPFKNIFIQPAAGDAGGALGTAFYIYNSLLNHKRVFKMESSYWGPEFLDKEIGKFLAKGKISAEHFRSEKLLLKNVAGLLREQKIIGCFQGRMEWGPRALGNRSILADPRGAQMKDIINAKIKHREPFRPFAPIIMEDRMKDYFEIAGPTPFMLFTAQINHRQKGKVPAITHVDNSARIQSVNVHQNKFLYNLLVQFKGLTGCPLLVNTSFNIRGEPIVCTPEDAYNCFMGTDMDYLILGKYLLDKSKMKMTSKHREFKKSFDLD
ncbi:MAG: carbamoyltransferase [bacterium]|nr:carbamoyltransferase [bacterium]